MAERILTDMLDWFINGSFTDFHYLIRTVAHENERITRRQIRSALNRIINMGYTLVNEDFEIINNANEISGEDYFCILTEDY